MQGVVKMWNGDRGFGFIRPDGAADDVFVHVRDCVGNRHLKVDQRVQLDTAPNERNGLTKAINVQAVGY